MQSAPYTRGLSNQMLNVTLGTGSAAWTYQQMVDSGSGLLDVPCRTPASQA